MAPILAPLSADACLTSKCAGLELGPAAFLFTPLCDDGAEEFSIKCHEQRGDAQVTISQKTIEIESQCSTVTSMRPSGNEMMVKLSLGSALCRPNVMAAFLGQDLTVDGADGTCQSIDVPARTKRLKHWQVALVPYDGDELYTEFGIVLHYAVLMMDGSLNFSPKTAKELSVTIKAEPHPDTNSLGQILYDCAQVAELAQYV